MRIFEHYANVERERLAHGNAELLLNSARDSLAGHVIRAAMKTHAIRVSFHDDPIPDDTDGAAVILRARTVSLNGSEQEALERFANVMRRNPPHGPLAFEERRELYAAAASDLWAIMEEAETGAGDDA